MHLDRAGLGKTEEHTARQLQKKYKEENVVIHITFIDVSKAFDFVSCDDLCNGADTCLSCSHMLFLNRGAGFPIRICFY